MSRETARQRPVSRTSTRRTQAVAWTILADLGLFCTSPARSQTSARSWPDVTERAFFRLDEAGQPQQPSPLTHTDVAIEVSGFLARATVTQQFENLFSAFSPNRGAY